MDSADWTPPPLPYDVNFELKEGGYEIWFSDRLADNHPDLVDEFGGWMEDEVGAVNLGQVDHKMMLADGPLTNELRSRLLAWWADRIEDLVQG